MGGRKLGEEEVKRNLNVRIKQKYISILKEKETNVSKAVEIAVVDYLKKKKYL